MELKENVKLTCKKNIERMSLYKNEQCTIKVVKYFPRGLGIEFIDV